VLAGTFPRTLVRRRHGYPRGWAAQPTVSGQASFREALGSLLPNGDRVTKGDRDRFWGPPSDDRVPGSQASLVAGHAGTATLERIGPHRHRRRHHEWMIDFRVGPNPRSRG
jgi:hypothetical protein